MNPFKNFDWSFKSIAKIIGALILGIIALTIVIALIGFSLRTVTNIGGNMQVMSRSNKALSTSYDMAAMEMDEDGGGVFYAGGSSIIMPPIPEPGYSKGDDAEDYEIREYNGSIKTRRLDETCGRIAELKGRDYVIFENSDKNDDYCYYRFKVKKENSDEIVKIIESLKPENFNANIRSIKKTIEVYDSELEILKKKLSSIEETLGNAQKSYDEISKIATQQRDAETLAKIIDSKLNLINQLTNERLSVKERIDRYNKSKEEQLDRLNYTFFSISVYKDLILDWKQIKDSWKYETRQMVSNVNGMVQGISVHLVNYLMRFAVVVLYFLISLVLLKGVWIVTKRIWKGKAGKKK